MTEYVEVVVRSTDDKPGIEELNSRVICHDCGAIHTLSTLVKALDEGHERNKSGDDPQK